MENFAAQAQKGKGEFNMSIEKWLEQYGEGSLNEYGEPAEQEQYQEEPEVEEDDSEAVEDADDNDVQEDPSDDEDDVQEDSSGSLDETPRKKQTAEENARFAEKRRQEQLEKQLQERLRQSKEYQTTQLLAEMYGVPQEELYDKLYEAKLAKESKEKNVPVEYLREREQLRQQQQQLQEQMQSLMFQQWQSRIESEKAQLKQQFSMLSDTDLDQSAQYMLETLGRTDIPLQQAVFALHGSRILDGLKNSAKNEALAEVSGRKRSPLPTKTGSKSSETVVLTDDERYIAKRLGLTDKEYSKWKEGN